MLELVRHTATYSPPVASRAFGYLGVAVYEAAAGGSDRLVSLAGQLNGLEAVPQREAGAVYDEAVIAHTVMATMVRSFFSNTGPTGQRAVAAADRKWGAEAAVGVPQDVIERSTAFGILLAESVIEWSRGDGGAEVENLGFPLDYALPSGEGKWVPTSPIALQQAPLLPQWGTVRPFAAPMGISCPIPPPPDYSTDPQSQFYREAVEVRDVSRALTAEQAAIARFWSDDPMLSTTPPGHWISIALQVAEAQQLPLDRSVDLLARLGVAMSDAFIGCWREKYVHNLIRPISYIRSQIDPAWEPILITPPFPEYPSGHSTVSGAAATVLTAFFGEDFAFVDATGSPDGRPPRTFPSFWAAADEAGISRLYGGIHYRAAIAFGLDQGRCIGAYTVALTTGK
ncbi:MAG: vanadium-dependent haloperoxidase [Devosia sp.]|nr:vanadium-dependent haloperoxidase [Devosia sp.]